MEESGLNQTLPDNDDVNFLTILYFLELAT